MTDINTFVNIGIKSDKAVDGLKKTERALDKAEKASADLSKQNKKTSEVFDKSGRKIVAATGKVDKEVNKLGKTTKKTDREINKLGRTSSTTDRKIKKLGDESLKTNTKIKSLGGGVKGLVTSFALLSRLGPAAIFAAIGIAAGKAASTFKNFEQEIANLSAITGATGADLKFLSDAARELGSSTTQSASEVAKAFRIVASAKPDLLESASALKEVTKQAILLSEAAGVDVAEAAETMASGLNQFNKSADAAAKFTDILAAGSKFGAASVGEMGVALKNVGTIANSVGVNFQQTNSLLQLLSANAIKGGEAGTKLRGVLLALETKTENFKPSVLGISESLRLFGEQGLTASDELKVFGLENITVGQILTQNVDKFDTLNTKLGTTGIAAEQAATRVDTLTGRIETMAGAYEELELTIAESTGFGKFLKETTVGLTRLFNLISGSLKEKDKSIFQEYRDQFSELSVEVKNFSLSELEEGLKRANKQIADGSYQGSKYARAIREIKESEAEYQLAGRGGLKEYQAALKKAEDALSTYIGKQQLAKKSKKLFTDAIVDAKNAIEDEAEAVKNATKETDKFSNSVLEVIAQLEEKRDALSRTAYEQLLHTALISAEVTAESLQGKAIEKVVYSLYKKKTALEEIRKSESNVIKETKKLAKEIKKVELAADPFANAWEEAMIRVDEAFADAWTGAFDSFEDFAKGIKNAFKNLLGELAHQALTKPILIGISSGFSGGAAASTAGGAVAQTGISAGISTISSAVGSAIAGYLPSASYFGIGTAATAGTAAAGATTSLGTIGGSALLAPAPAVGAGGTTLASVGASPFVAAIEKFGPAVSALVGALQGYDNSGLKGAAAGAAGGYFGAQAGAAAGAAIGSVVPVIGTAIGAAVGAILGGLLGGSAGSKVFGGKYETKGSALQLQVGQEGLEAQLVEFQKKKGGLFGSNKRRENFIDLDEESKVYQVALDTIKEQVIEAYNVLGQDLAEGSLDSFTRGFERIGLSGQTDEQIAESIARFFKNTADMLVKDVDALDGLTFKSLIELSQAFVTVNSVLDVIGVSALEASVKNSKYAKSLLEASGGLDILIQNAASFHSFFVETRDAATIFADDLKASLMEVDQALPATRDGFRDLVQGLDLTTESGIKAFAALTGLSEAANTYYTQLEELQKKEQAILLKKQAQLDELQKKEDAFLIKQLAQAEELKNKFHSFFVETRDAATIFADDLKASLMEVDQALPATRDGFRDLVQGLDLTTESGIKAFAALTGLSEAADTYYSQLEESKSNYLSDLEASQNKELAILLQNQSRLEGLLQKEQAILVKNQAVYSKFLSDTVDNALDSLVRSIKNEKEKIQNEFEKDFQVLQEKNKLIIARTESGIDSAQTTVGILKTLSNKLTDALEGLGSSQENRKAAQKEIFAAATIARAGGSLQGVNLDGALKAIAEPSEGFFSTLVDFNRDQQLTNNALNDINKETVRQLTTAERNLAALKNVLESQKQSSEKLENLLREKFDKEILALDSQVIYAQQMVDGIRGVDNSIVTLAQGFATLASTLTTEFENKPQENTAQHEIINAIKQSISNNQELISSFNSQKIVTDGIFAGKTQQEIADIPGFKEALAKNPQFIAAIKAANDESVPGFAAGGRFTGGFRLVGENGPEIEATGPSRISSNSQTKSILGNDAVVRELREIKIQSRQIGVQILSNTSKIKKIEERWEVDGLPANRVVSQ